MNTPIRWISTRGIRLSGAIVGGLALLLALSFAVGLSPQAAFADPVPPPVGYPKLTLSVKAVTPTLTYPGGAVLSYTVEIRNTGAYTAAGVTLSDPLPASTSYNGDAWASAGLTPTVAGGTLTWVGDVGFDATVVLRFSVTVSDTFTGTIHNTAVVSHPLITRPVTVTAETIVADRAILSISKSASPAVPGANKPLIYTLVVANYGQPALSLPITVTDYVPTDTLLLDIGPGGYPGPLSDVVTWTRTVSLGLGETTVFTFAVEVGDVLSGTVIANDVYHVAGAGAEVAMGEPYTITVVDPILALSKSVWPDPPGTNREMTYTLTLLNVGSLATNLVITDRIPAGVDYRRGGMEVGGVVSWTLPALDFGAFAQFTYTVYISDVMGVPVINANYTACCAEGICAAGEVLTRLVKGPTFAATASLDPIAKKPGGGGGPVTPTLIVRNLGPGNALGAQATLFFKRISVSAQDLRVIPPGGVIVAGPICGDKCTSYVWTGDLGYGQTVTFTTAEGQSTIGGEEGTLYTATVVISDSFRNGVATSPVTGTAVGKVTHMANLIPVKSAPAVIGRGQIMTYTIQVANTALATDEPPYPYLIEFVPTNTTVISISHGGVLQEISGSVHSQAISWTLPGFGTGDFSVPPRRFSVRVDADLISGTQIVNDDYQVYWYEPEDTRFFSTTGKPITTAVAEVGLIDSYKVVTPALVLPGPGNVLTYFLHIVNTSPLSLTGVSVYDWLPWQSSTYRRDAVASAGNVVSDIVSIRWQGDVDAFSEAIVTATVLVDADYRGPVTNTAVISHSDLLTPVMVHAVAYVTDRPELRIVKTAAPDPVERGAELVYTLHLLNLGQQATGLVVTDTLPSNVTYVDDSATGNGSLVEDQLQWQLPVLGPGARETLEFRVVAGSGSEISNADYGVRCAEGFTGLGAPVITRITRGGAIYLPLVLRNY